MVSIDTIRPDGPVRIGDRTHAGSSTVPANTWLKAFVTAFRARMQKHRTRKQLHHLTDDQLRDIGISRAQARFEADKPFWWYRH